MPGGCCRLPSYLVCSGLGSHLQLGRAQRRVLLPLRLRSAFVNLGRRDTFQCCKLHQASEEASEPEHNTFHNRLDDASTVGLDGSCQPCKPRRGEQGVCAWFDALCSREHWRTMVPAASSRQDSHTLQLGVLQVLTHFQAVQSAYEHARLQDVRQAGRLMHVDQSSSILMQAKQGPLKAAGTHLLPPILHSICTD